MIKAVFFDIDDTLYDTSGFAKRARKAALQAMIDAGLPLYRNRKLTFTCARSLKRRDQTTTNISIF